MLSPPESSSTARASHAVRASPAIAVVQAAYEVDRSEQEWLTGLAHSAVGMAGPAGTSESYARLVRVVDGVPIGSHATSSARVGFLQAAMAIEQSAFSSSATASQSRAMYGATFAITTSDSCHRYGVDLAEMDELFRTHLGEFGIRDAFNLCAPDTSGEVTLVGVALSRPRSYSPRAYATWSRVAAHVASGARLRHALSLRNTSALQGAVGIFDPRRGTVVHASGTTRDRRGPFRRAAMAVDRARTTSVASDAQTALDLWRGLFEGRWSIFDLFDTDGRRFLVAHENAPEVASDARLTRRERQVIELVASGNADPLVAYILGLSISTVRTHLRRALHKLRLRSSPELVELRARLFPRADG